MGTGTDRLAANTSTRAAVTGSGCVVLLVAVYLLAVWTRAGQRWEDAVLTGAESAARTPLGQHANAVLDAINAPTVVSAVVLVIGIGLARRLPALGFLCAGIVATSVLSVEVLQRTVLRPILLEHGRRREDQSFPSGHTAVAMSVMCALVLVTPYRFRGVVGFLASLWAATVAVATVAVGWHRPSDTLGSDLVVLMYACAALCVLAARGRVRAAPPGRTAERALAVSYGIVTVGGLVVAALAASPLTAGRALALSGSAGVAWTLLALLRRVDVSRAGARPARRSGR